MGASDGRQGADDFDIDPPIPTVIDTAPPPEPPPPMPTEIEIEYVAQTGDDVIRIAHTPDDLDLNPPEARERVFDSEPVTYDPPQPNQIDFEPVAYFPVEERVVIQDYEVVQFDSHHTASDGESVVHGVADHDDYDTYDADDATGHVHEATDAFPDDASADSPPHAVHVDEASDV